jgi:hypothetical protein
MTRGAILIAHNNNNDYYRMACWAAKRINHFLGIPVTIITDQNTLDTTAARPSNSGSYQFDHTILIDPDRTNKMHKMSWFNKSRHLVYELTPYDETLVLDTDYVVNSEELLKTFSLPSDFVCYTSAKYIFADEPNELISEVFQGTYWATVLRFRKGQRAQDIFHMITTIQENYDYYGELYKFLSNTFRNDYALTIALRTVNGQLELPQDSIPGQLQHLDSSGKVEMLDYNRFKLIHDVDIRGRLRPAYIEIVDRDFHMLGKPEFMNMIATDEEKNQ